MKPLQSNLVKISRSDLIKEMKVRFPYCTKLEATRVIYIFITTIEKIIAKGKNIKLVGFGTFSINKIPARYVQNLKDGEPILIAEHYQLRFKTGDKLKNAVKKAKRNTSNYRS